MLAQFAQESALCCPEKLARWPRYLPSVQQQPAQYVSSFRSSRNLFETPADRPARLAPSTRLVIQRRRPVEKRPKSAPLGASENLRSPDGELTTISEPPEIQARERCSSRVTFGEETTSSEMKEAPGAQPQQQQQQQVLREARIEKTKKRLLQVAQAEAALKNAKKTVDNQDSSGIDESCPSTEDANEKSRKSALIYDCTHKVAEQKRRANSLRPCASSPSEVDSDKGVRRQSTPAQVCSGEQSRHEEDDFAPKTGFAKEKRSTRLSTALQLPFEKRSSATSSALSPTPAPVSKPPARRSFTARSSAPPIATAAFFAGRSSKAMSARSSLSSVSQSPRVSVLKPRSPLSSRASVTANFHNPMAVNIGWEHERCIKRKSVNRAILSKLDAFDKRRQQAAAAEQQKEGPSEFQVDGDGTPKLNSNRGEEVELGFHIVNFSSQKGRCEASRLLEKRGKWESNTHSDEVHNEYLVFGLHGAPCAVSGIELSMGGTSANPKRCRMQYSDTSQVGPWLDAWNFTVEPAGALNYRSRHQYGLLAKHFRNLVLSISGSFEVAWYMFDVNENGRLTKADFESAYAKFQERYGSASMQVDLQKVFREFDPNGLGTVSLDDILSEQDPRLPMAPWWRLLIVDNYGSPNTVMLYSPLKLFSTEMASEEAAQTRKGEAYQQTLFMEGIVAGHQDLFQTSPELRMLRRTAKQYDLPLDEVDSFNETFKKVSSDGASITRPEFDKILSKLHGLGENRELPTSRLDFFWNQADEDRSGTLDFDEFLVWYFKKSPLKIMLKARSSSNEK